MRILQVTDFYRPIIGGLERHVETLSKELARRGHQVSVATLAQTNAATREEDDGTRIYRLTGWSRALSRFYQSADRRFHPTVPDPGVVTGLRDVIRQERPQIIHVHSWMLYSVLPLIAWSKAQLVVTLHDYGLVCAKKTYMRQGSLCAGPGYRRCLQCTQSHYGRTKAWALTSGLFVSRRAHGRVDRYLAVSTAVADACVAAIYPQRCLVVPTFIPDNIWGQPATATHPVYLPPRGEYILFVGVLSRHKGVQMLIEAHASLPERPSLVLIGTPYGDGPAHYPEGVQVFHNMAHVDVMAAWAGCIMGVVPSVWPDPCPQVAIEAMAAGKPIVASAVGGIPDLVADGVTGVLVPPGDTVALRRAIQTLLADPDLRTRMGNAAYQRAGHFLASRVIDRIEEIYGDLITRTGHRSWD